MSVTEAKRVKRRVWLAMPGASRRPVHKQTYSYGEPDSPSGPLRGRWAHCRWATLPSLPPGHSPAPEGLIRYGPRPLTSHSLDPQDIAQRPVKPPVTPARDGQTPPQGQLWTAFFVESLLLQECPCLSQVWTQLNCVQPPASC